VRTLTPAQAELLARHVGVLLLSNLAVDERIAACLGTHAGSLLVPLDDASSHLTLAAILRHRGPVHLDGLKTIDVARAGLLAGQCRANGVGGLDGLFLPHVKQLTAPAAAILATHRGGGLSLGGIELLTEAVAGQLVRHPLLELDGLKSVTDRVAAILATHDGGGKNVTLFDPNATGDGGGSDPDASASGADIDTASMRIEPADAVLTVVGGQTMTQVLTIAEIRRKPSSGARGREVAASAEVS
jgi:hypothetical protein